MPSELLARYVAGEADASERERVQRWAAEDPTHARELERFQQLWDWTEDLPAAFEPDVDRAWQRVASHMAGFGGSRVIPFRTVTRLLAAAAMLTGLFFAVRFFLATPVERFAAADTHLPVELADGSSVTLSPGSRLEVSLGNTRRTELEGSAYFEVEPDAVRPFTVEADGVEVRVLGTAFTVDAADTSDFITVRVRHGRVRVTGERGDLELTDGQGARVDRLTGEPVPQAAPSVERWGDRILQFHDAPLARVVATLQEVYPVRIDLNGANVERCRLTATFDDEPVDLVLQVIADTFGLEVRVAEDGTYVLEGEGC